MNPNNLLSSFYGPHGLNMDILRGLRAAAYARFSDEKKSKKDSATIEVQFKKITEFCHDYGIIIPDDAWFKDEGKTGTNTDRAGFDQLCRGAERHDFDIVVIYDLTRGSRDVGDWFAFRKEMRLLGLPVLSTFEKLGDIANPADFLNELMTVGFGQHLVLQTRKKTIDAIADLAEDGKFCGGIPPLGYDIVNGNYVINEREAEAVRTIFALYAAGKSYSYIIDVLAQEGYVGKRGRPIGTNSLHSILTNDRYIGIYSWNRRQVKFFRKWAGGKPNPKAVEIAGKIPRIIDDETWERVRKRMETNKKNLMNKSRVHREYLLSGLLKCGKCGASFVGVTTTSKKGKGSEYKFYCCGNKKRLKNCDCKNISANEIEPLVVNVVKESLLNGEMIEKTADAIIAASTPENGEASSESLMKELSGINTKIENLTKVLASGLDSDSVRDAVLDLEARRKILQHKINEIVPIKPVSRELLIKELSADVQRVTDDPSCMKEILNKYIVDIKITDTCVEINAVGALNTIGCGGRI